MRYLTVMQEWKWPVVLAGSWLMTHSLQASFVTGDVRVQPLGPHLVRIEQRGPSGFEDRETFTVCGRSRDPVSAQQSIDAGCMRVETETYRVVVPDGAMGVDGIRIETPGGRLLCELSDAMRTTSFLPVPSDLPATWVLGDSPRVVPPAWGALPPPEGMDDPNSGWDLENDAADWYVFFPAASGYAAFRRDFVQLTGAVPRVPLYALGLWYSRYHPYDENGALEVIRRFREAGIPLDVFVADTDWRTGGSCGYAVNRELFPDMARFIRRAHEQQVRIMLNDHPEPQGNSALDPGELRFRQKGLQSMLALGVDLWWFDRNWHTHLQAPVPGLAKEVWGMRLYHDITKEFYPDRRTLVLSNVDGINNGRLDTPSHPAAHRFPVWWTGDTVAGWEALRAGVINGVDSGLLSLLPYVHEDLGGHHDQPNLELYVRFMQFGAFSPVARIHCSNQAHRCPWAYGAEGERITGDFFRLRYRLLPTLYAATVAAHQTGVPLLQRCDLEWPDWPEAADSTQYLLGEDLLVAPILSPAPENGPAERSVWIPPGEWEDLWSGRIHPGPGHLRVQCPLEEMPVFARRGGLVFSVPQRWATGRATWPELVVDAYVPAHNGEQVRMLHEDDGETAACGPGSMATTEVGLRRDGSSVEVRMVPRPVPAGIRLENRDLTVRVHLPPGTEARQFRIDGRPVAGGQVREILPESRRSARLFSGAGSRPPGEAGPVLEWRGQRNAAVPAVFSVVLAESTR